MGKHVAESQFEIRGDIIRLDQLLKASGVVGSGGEAHLVVEQGLVRVDGDVELRKRAQLRVGQQVQMGNELIVLIGAAER